MSKATTKDGFILYKSDYEAYKHLTDAEIGRLFRAVFAYQIEETIVVDKDIEPYFRFIKARFDRDNALYQEKCEKARDSINTRWERERANTDEYGRIQPNTKATDRIGLDRMGEDMTREDISTSQQESNIVVDKGDSKGGKSFKPPLLPDIEQFFGQMGRTQDAASFFAYYSQNDWHFSGGDKMKTAADWKKAARKWTPPPQAQTAPPEDNGKGITVAGYKKTKWN